MKGILMSPMMAQAVCRSDGYPVKTQTRRVIHALPVVGIHRLGMPIEQPRVRYLDLHGRCEYKPGEVRCLLTTWAVPARYDATKPTALSQRAGNKLWHAGKTQCKPLCNVPPLGKSRPGRFMPNHLRPLMPAVKIRSVYAERLQDISDADIKAEGIWRYVDGWLNYPFGEEFAGLSERDAFKMLWDSINAKRGKSWDSNPWVWRIEFRRVS